MPCLFPLIYQKAVFTGRGFKPNFLVNFQQAIAYVCESDSVKIQLR
ncbi:MAG TPA: hypothetical protein VK184_00380 [Nostocaceae cyanobacterium]|nr:hypothetical protein [Nostocaceae cyanobacterium]